ncbi:Cthe_2314 family HEPN domain-containing protein [Viridibacillus sp. FSL H8-0123]|uniref:Cthe_2314 family HEPN domain-containing protein n=1 Tax=Viridibacillus sp. FSL H8-0123 TaxID=1928922 RepID=UPI00096DC7AC|nr:Cthe_2314 family HEPN domain-containing protein [Viridibacillus sp. FSL H8-0123]OMC83351.1 hypothetical protein BK130_07325 [Viridibacillus sp. FSL H8-0123]
MAVDLVQCLTLPSIGEWEKFNSSFDEEFPELQFATREGSFDLKEVVNGVFEADSWKYEFNWRVLNISTNYVLLMHFFEKGIPDNEYKNLTGEKMYIHIWFSFYAESLLARIIGAYDILFQIVNADYQLKVKKGTRFNIKVLQKLKPFNKRLHSCLSTFREDESYIKLVTLRNDFIHNNTPTNLDFGFSEEKPGVRSFGKGKYVKSQEVVDIANNGIKHLQDIVKKIQELS